MSPDDTDTDNLSSLDEPAVSASENGANGQENDAAPVDASAPELDAEQAEAGVVEEAVAEDAEAGLAEAEAVEVEAEAGEAEAVEVEADAVDVEAEAGEVEAEAGEVEAEADDVEAEAGEAGAGDDGEAEVLTVEQLLAESAAVVDNPYTRPGRWFVVHTQSGYEKKVKQNLEARIHSMNAEEAVYEVVIPMEDYVDFKNGKRVVAQRKMFPGYLLVRAELDDTAWFVIRNTPGVTGFVGQGAKPSPLPRKDVEAFLMPKGTEEQVATRAKPRLEYEIGETVRVREGPFADFSGEVIEINEDQLKLKVLVNIFGRETPVELEFSKVAKL
jgi:transcription termination/antitermination protein NusG